MRKRRIVRREAHRTLYVIPFFLNRTELTILKLFPISFCVKLITKTGLYFEENLKCYLVYKLLEAMQLICTEFLSIVTTEIL